MNQTAIYAVLATVFNFGKSDFANFLKHCNRLHDLNFRKHLTLIRFSGGEVEIVSHN